MGYHPSVLYSISNVLNDIGNEFIDDGIEWLSSIFQNNKNLFSDELEINTLYYLENIIRRYIFTNRYKIRTTFQLREKILIILDFLVERGSVTGYMLREDIL